jgi:hypothetical protein
LTCLPKKLDLLLLPVDRIRLQSLVHTFESEEIYVILLGELDSAFSGGTQLYSWGSNSSGELGVESIANEATLPTHVQDMADEVIVQVRFAF